MDTGWLSFVGFNHQREFLGLSAEGLSMFMAPNATIK